MAGSDAVWGIDLGQCALKALRCRLHEDRKRLVADAFDYIEYPKILSQPGAEPSEMISEALKQFLSRNSIKGDSVAISVSGQAGLARFIKLPPVEVRKIPDIVRFEARQQIPFDLNDVIWDYQRMDAGMEEEGFALETEIGLFAMKRDAVFRTLEPFQSAGIDVDFVQLTPLALYNFALYDLLRDLPPPDEYDPDNPPGSVVIISIGTDATDLVVTNGFRVWQRNVPLGGSHFTKALTKELKLTFAKAEHLKRNAAAAQDPKAVFQAMRPVFNDLLTELQRSIGYFSSLNRTARIERVVALGNAMKLPGLRRYLSQNLGFEIERVESYANLTGMPVLAAPAFKENALSFGVCYGLTIQGLGRGGLKTNLLPKEILKDRMVRRKKPWAVAAAASLLAGLAIGVASHARALWPVEPTKWEAAERQAQATDQDAKRLIGEAEEARKDFQNVNDIGRHLVANVEGRVVWLEMLSALSQCMPSDTPERKEELRVVSVDTTDRKADTPQEKARKISSRQELHVESLDCMRVPDLATWFEGVKQWYKAPETEGDASPPDSTAPTATAETDADGTAAGADGSAEAPREGPSGSGYIIQISGYHYHNLKEHGRNLGAEFVRSTLLHNLHAMEVTLPTSTGTDQERDGFTMEELGIRYPVLIGDPPPFEDVELIDPNTVPDAPETAGHGATARPPEAGERIPVKRFPFVVQFCWQPVMPSERAEAREEKEAQRRAAAGRQPE